MANLLKYEYRRDRRRTSWLTAMVEARVEVADLLEENPSLKARVADLIDDGYSSAARLASIETKLPDAAFPSACPYSARQILDQDFLPEG